MALNKKYSKSLIERFEEFEKDFNIEELNVSIFDGYAGSDYYKIKVIGEIIGEKLPCDILIIITVYNDSDEIIGMELGINIRSSSFEGIATFSENVSIIGTEKIAKIRVYPIKDPSAIW